MNNKFKDKIDELQNLTLDQEKYNSIISELISNMRLDDNVSDEEKKEDEYKDDKKQDKPKNKEQQAHDKKSEQEEMSIDAGIPDLDHEAKDSNKAEDEIELQDNSKSDFKKRANINFGDYEYKTYTEEFDEIIKAEDLENSDELTRLRKSLDQQLLQLKNFISKLANKLQRKLLARQNRSWNFDLDEGILDTSKAF